jgi:hypothetical protein
MTFDAIKLGGQWVPCDFKPHREPVISVPGPNGMRSHQQNSANTLLHIPNLMEVEHLLREGPYDVRCDGRMGVFTHTAMRIDRQGGSVLLGHIQCPQP